MLISFKGGFFHAVVIYIEMTLATCMPVTILLATQCRYAKGYASKLEINNDHCALKIWKKINI